MVPSSISFLLVAGVSSCTSGLFWPDTGDAVSAQSTAIHNASHKSHTHGVGVNLFNGSLPDAVRTVSC